MRFPLMVLVVCAHSYMKMESGSFSSYYSIAISHVIAHLAVPFFFVISGFLFYVHLEDWNWNAWNRKIKNRCSSILIPYLLWIGIYIIVKGQWHQESISDWIQLFWNSTVWGAGKLDIWGHSAVTTAPILYPFWFLRDLMVLLCLSPIVFGILRQREGHSPIIPLIWLAILFFFYATGTSLVIPGLSFESLFFFSLGAFFSLHRLSLTEVFRSYRLPLFLLTSILLIVEICLDSNHSYWGNIIHPFYIVLGVIATWLVVALTIEKVSPENTIVHGITHLRHASFFLFAIHAMLLPWVGKGLRLLHLPALLFYLFRIIAVVLLCFLIYQLMYRISPKCCRWLGSR